MKNDETLLNAQKHLKSYQSLIHLHEKEVPVRQQINADYSIELALKDNVDWLIHLDSDELFYMMNSTSLNAHFQNLNTENIGNITYINCEGVPEGRETIGDFFTEITLFRRHISLIPFSKESMEAMEFWKSRTNHKQYMISYDNGKSAVRVMEGVLSGGCHNWKLPENSPLKTVTCIPDARNLDISHIYHAEDVLVLHYVVCGLYWYLKKYKILDSFSNFWFGGKLKIAPCFHLDSRDRFLKGDYNELKEAYLREVVVNDKDEIERQLKSQVCTRFSDIGDRIKEQFKKIFKEEYEVVQNLVPDANDIKRTDGRVEMPEDGPTSTVNTLPLEKMWLLSSLVSQYIVPNSK